MGMHPLDRREFLLMGAGLAGGRRYTHRDRLEIRGQHCAYSE